jgi:hypothetical protein
MENKNNDTPWTDARSFSGDWVRCTSAANTRILERHLRRIIEAWERPVGLQHTEVSSAIQAAKEEIK